MNTKKDVLTCDECGCELNNAETQEPYYANGNQEGKLCYECHIKEMMYSDDEY